jgi:hypothetical protein
MVDLTNPPSDDESKKKTTPRSATENAMDAPVKATQQYDLGKVESAAAVGAAPTPPSAPEIASKATTKAKRKRTVALFVAHGMGQQIPFQTLDQIATGLRKQDGGSTKKNDRWNVRGVKFKDQWLSRIELELKSDTKDEVEVHLYEGYWAPRTEGKITTRGVIEFLWGAARNGIKNGSRNFDRWLFGKYREFPSPIRIVLYLLIALMTVIALVTMNTTIALVAAGRAFLEKPAAWLTNGLFADLTTTFNVVVTGMVIFGVSLGIAFALRRLKLPDGVRRAWGLITIILFIAVLFVVILAALSIGLLFYGHVKLNQGDAELWHLIVPKAMVNGFNDAFDFWALLLAGIVLGLFLLLWIVKIGIGVWRDVASYKKGGGYTILVVASLVLLCVAGAWLAGSFVDIYYHIRKGDGAIEIARNGLAWPLLIAVSAFVRKILVQYVGDVAIYVTPYKLDGYFQLRDEIKSCVEKVAHAVYAMKRQDGPEPKYDKIYMVGHSLGSVVVYDVLNRLVNDDEAAGRPLDVVARTPLLLTFGSPLDKTAFLFAAQRHNTEEAREALAATVQPLLQEYRFRPERWINIYSPWDIISGDLGFYDPPDSRSTQRVENLIDRDATTLLAAHVEYWSNPFLFETLYKAL